MNCFLVLHVPYVPRPGEWLALTRPNATTPGAQPTSAATTTFGRPIFRSARSRDKLDNITH